MFLTLTNVTRHSFIHCDLIHICVGMACFKSKRIKTRANASLLCVNILTY
jgi:hypothetical protein